MSKTKWFLVRYRERSGEHESDGKFLVYTANIDRAVDTVLSDFYFESTEKKIDGYWDNRGYGRVVNERGFCVIPKNEAKVLMKHGTTVLHRDGGN